MADRAQVYDAAAEQGIVVEVQRRINNVLKSYSVTHIIASATDDKYLSFDKACNVRVVSHPDKSVETVDDADEAALKLYDSLILKVTGWGDESGKNVDDVQKRKVIFKNLLVCAIVPKATEVAVAGNIDEDKPWEQAEDTAPASVGLRCLFNGAEVVTHHFLKPASAEQKRRHESLTSRKSYVAGAKLKRNIVVVPSTAKPLGKLYDELCERTEGYSSSVPLWHKLAVVAYVFSDAEDSDPEE